MPAHIRYGQNDSILEVVVADRWMRFDKDIHVPLLESVTDAYILSLFEMPAPETPPWKQVHALIRRAYFSEFSLSPLPDDKERTGFIPAGIVHVSRDLERTKERRGFRPLRDEYLAAITSAYESST